MKVPYFGWKLLKKLVSEPWRYFFLFWFPGFFQGFFSLSAFCSLWKPDCCEIHIKLHKWFIQVVQDEAVIAYGPSLIQSRLTSSLKLRSFLFQDTVAGSKSCEYSWWFKHCRNVLLWLLSGLCSSHCNVSEI